jgi:2-methylisocitrate lyase-like PEP mutase family enzyme
MVMGAGPPMGYTVDDMAEIGYAFIMFASSALGVAANAIASLFKEMRRSGTDAGYLAANPGPYHDALALMRAARLDDYIAVEKRYTSSFSIL